MSVTSLSFPQSSLASYRPREEEGKSAYTKSLSAVRDGMKAFIPSVLTALGKVEGLFYLISLMYFNLIKETHLDISNKG